MGGWFPEMIGMIENHENLKFQMFFALEEQNHFTAQPKRIFSLESHTCQSK